MPDQGKIVVRGARQNNLKNLDIDIPLNQFIVVTGLSGSGKSSLAFDTLYAEGQRRYTETFSPYTRQFLDRMDKPQADRIDGIPPAIAISQANSVRTSRSTVGTMTEIADYLKMLFSRMAVLIHPETGKLIRRWTPNETTEHLLEHHEGAQALILFEVPFPKKTPWSEVASFLRGQGFLRIFLNGKPVRLDGDPPSDFPKKLSTRDDDLVVPVIQDRITLNTSSRARITEAIKAAFLYGKGIALVSLPDLTRTYTQNLTCPDTRETFDDPSPSLFAFNNPVGACPTCKGFGRTIGIDYNLALPERDLSIDDGVVRPFQSGMSQECQKDLMRACEKKGVPTDVAYSKLTPRQQKWVIEGEGDWYGVKGYFDWLESKTYKMHVRVLLSRYRSYHRCPDCKGTRFKPHIHQWQIEGKSLAQINEMPLKDLAPHFEKLQASDESTEVLLEQVRSRLHFLVSVGLGYLTLNRSTRTLSGGEVQRVNLTTCLGTSLTGTLFILDEPSIGLHSRDTALLLSVLYRLRDRGNTVMVVEHDTDVIQSADSVLELGPGRGNLGGELIFQGTQAGLKRNTKSVTGQYLAGKKTIELPSQRRPLKGATFLTCKGARKHNLQDIDFELPLRRFNAITGVSGSGKSTLVHEVIHKHILLNLQKAVDEPATVKSFRGAKEVRDVVLVDQSPLTQTPRSTPLLYLGVYDHVRELFASTDDAQSQGLNASHFSFNSGTGRCERCQGAGYEKVSMQFLSDLYVTCPVCEGKRFQPHVLQVHYRGKSISDLLDMTVEEGRRFFDVDEPLERARAETCHRNIASALELLCDVGLGYLRLGQPVSQLSGGEAQRLKLISHLNEHLDGDKRSRKKKQQPEEKGRTYTPRTNVLILDEPTTGLHLDDISLLLKCLQRLVDQGHTLIVIEHNLEVIKCADWIIDLGPEAGEDGGLILAQGTPEEVCLVEGSHTAKFLAPCLEPKSSRVKESAQPLRSKRAKVQSHQIEIRGARHHNLKNVDVDIPLQQMVVLTGLSGSGKSSLAFDLLFAEGQRRYLDCLSSYARQFVEQMEKPNVDAISGIPPAVAIEQRTTRGGSKSTVATVTEIYHFLRLLYAKLGVQHDPDTEEAAIRQDASQIIRRIRRLLKTSELTLLAPLIKHRKGYHTEVGKWAARKNFPYLRVDGEWIEPEKFTALDRYKEHSIDLVLGNLDSSTQNLEILINEALNYGHGTLYTIDNHSTETTYSTLLYCPTSERSFDELDPRMFSFNSPHGWCPECHGFGSIAQIPEDNKATSEAEKEQHEELARESLKEETVTCPSCNGARLNTLARAVRLGGKPIPEINAMTVSEFGRFIGKLKLTGRDKLIARDIIPELKQRVHFLESVGLGYLNLDRGAPTLSGGESQRIRLAAQLGSNLQGVLYVLDEPTIGLHPRDNDHLISTLRSLQQKGNSLIVVEHDEDTMRQADQIIDLGPGAGVNGGSVVAQGNWKKITKQEGSITGQLLGDPIPHPMQGSWRKVSPQDSRLKLKGASCHNLSNVDIELPLQRLTVVSGVSGSGKSTLLRRVLIPAVEAGLQSRSKKKKKSAPPADRLWESLEGDEAFQKIIEVDQSPIGKTSRSAICTYIGLMDTLRKLFASTNEAKVRGFSATDFSFNAGQGRCPSCSGAGQIKVEMNFLPTVYVPCDTCNGKRYRPELLAVTYRDKNIFEVLEMSIDEAIDFFDAQSSIRTPLELARDTGLGYLKLGQTSNTLSGGEAQRLKLISELAPPQLLQQKEKMRSAVQRDAHYLYVLEEPTVGLHIADVRRLLTILHRLVDLGHTVVVIEHNLDVLAEADWLIDLGPESGPKGGKLIAQGPIEKVLKSKRSHTAHYLKKFLASE